MSCPGLHCPGCTGPQTAAIGAALVAGLVIAAETVTVVAENIIPIAAVVVTCFVLSVAASMWLERLSDRRGVTWGHARGIYSRADYIAPVPAKPQVTQAAHQVIEHHHYVHAVTPGPVPAVVRTALPGKAGDATTKEE